MEMFSQSADEKNGYNFSPSLVEGNVEFVGTFRRATPPSPLGSKPLTRALMEIDRIRAELEAVIESSFTKSCLCGLDFKDQSTFDEHRCYSGHGRQAQ